MLVSIPLQQFCWKNNPSIAIQCFNIQQFLGYNSNISQHSTSHLICMTMPKDTLDGCSQSKPPWNSRACRWCPVMIISSAVRPLVLLTIVPCNDFLSMNNQTYLLLSHFSLAVKPLINYFSLGNHAMSFRWKLCPLWSSMCIDLFFALLLLAIMPQNDSVFLCTTNAKAVSHQISICLRLFTDH